ncbi:hypothetical protein BKA62DRAFT_145246 [Auriculariales sp. MPI-PUGE-AT-0066]|nr:hypothetical protein BKA62DRAFT_145246 [Auriculariales sp. MPI-PUGE-AT-0066]
MDSSSLSAEPGSNRTGFVIGYMVAGMCALIIILALLVIPLQWRRRLQYIRQRELSDAQYTEVVPPSNPENRFGLITLNEHRSAYAKALYSARANNEEEDQLSLSSQPDPAARVGPGPTSPSPQKVSTIRSSSRRMSTANKTPPSPLSPFPPAHSETAQKAYVATGKLQHNTPSQSEASRLQFGTYERFHSYLG